MEEYEKRGYLREDFRLFHLRDSRGTRTDYHYHEFHKILLLIAGSGSYVVEGRRYLLQSGDIVLVGKGCVHRPEFAGDSPYERIILYLSPEFAARYSEPDCDLAACFGGNPVLRPGEAERRRLFDTALALEQELHSDAFGHTVLSRQYLIRMLVELGRQQRECPVTAPIPASSDRVLQMLSYLDAHLTEDLSIDDLAARFFLSKYHMMRLFRRETGCTIHVYLTQRRLMLARDLIRQGLRSTDACYRAGFGSYSSFTRAYARRFGTTPTGRPGPLQLPEGFRE